MTRRLFSSEIIGSDAFLEMPTSSRELYFQLGMYADDDGFVNPKKIMRMVQASDDDLKVLLSKRFLLTFESGVVVIKHWLIHNTIRKDRYHETKYLEEKNGLFVKDNSSYTELATNGQPLGNQTAAQVKLSKVNTDTSVKQKISNKMKANKMGKYREDESSDSFENVIDLDTGQSVTEPKKKISKNKTAISGQRYFSSLAEKNTGTKVIESNAGYFLILDAMNKGGLTDVLLKQKIDDWFSSGRPNDELVSITRCFSHNEINTWKVNNSIK